MKNKKSIIKAVLAFGTVLVLALTGLILDKSDQTAAAVPNENARICLYGEAHGYKKCYDTELEEWRRFYNEGCRNLFVELPYYMVPMSGISMIQRARGI